MNIAKIAFQRDYFNYILTANVWSFPQKLILSGEKGTVVLSWWECRLVQPLWKTVWIFLRKLKRGLLFDSVIPWLGLYPENSESPIQKNLCTAIFIAAQFTIAKCWKQPKCPSVNEWIKKLVHLHNGILLIRKKEGTLKLHDSMGGTGEHYAK